MSPGPAAHRQRAPRPAARIASAVKTASRSLAQSSVTPASRHSSGALIASSTSATNEPKIAQLALTQERDLRSWLFADDENAPEVADAPELLRGVGHAVEDGFAVPVDVIVTGEVYDDAARAAAADAAESGAVVVPAFDALDTMAGQGTVAVEIARQLGRTPDLVTVPVGGGGLLGGMATWMAAHSSSTRLVGVEPEDAASMAAALAAGAPVDLETVSPFVDGAAVRRAGDLTHAAVAATGTELTSVAEGAICVEMLAMYQTDGIIAEPAGAMATTVLADLDITPGSTLVAVVSGGNNDVSRYAEIVERALIHEGRKHYFLVDFPQEPGALRRFLDEVLGPDDDIAYFEYVKRSNRETGPALVGLELGHPRDLLPLLARMETSPLTIERVDPGSPLFRFIG